MSKLFYRTIPYKVIVSHKFVAIGCKYYLIQDIKDFFVWYFGDRKRYRYLLWSTDWEPLNIYKMYDNPGSVKSYPDGEDNFIIDEADILVLFISLMEAWGE